MRNPKNAETDKILHVCILLLMGLLLPIGLAAQDAAVSPARESTAETNQAARGGVEETELRLGSLVMGTDLHSREGKRLGDIVDFALDLEGQRVTHAFVMTGGILTLGGDVRAVPATAIYRRNETYGTTVTKEEFEALDLYEREDLTPLMRERGEELAQVFGLEPQPDPEGKLTRYTELSLKTVEARDGAEVGPIDDILINVETRHAPYIRVFSENYPPLDASVFFLIPLDELSDIDSIRPQLDMPLEALTEADEVETGERLRRKDENGAELPIYRMYVTP